jgi:mannose/fructose/N-acetylgalactosamine-specific phosphotransferase system component IIC
VERAHAKRGLNKRGLNLGAGLVVGVVIGLLLGNVGMGIGIGLAIGIAMSLMDGDQASRQEGPGASDPSRD